MWVDIKERLPEKDRIVWCHRDFVNAKGNAVKMLRLAQRRTAQPYFESGDSSQFCMWYGLNDDEGRSWADCTVTKWREIDAPVI